MQPGRRQRHDLVARGLVNLSVFCQQIRAGQKQSQVFDVFDRRRYPDLSQGAVQVAALDQRGNFDGPGALA